MYCIGFTVSSIWLVIYVMGFTVYCRSLGNFLSSMSNLLSLFILANVSIVDRKKKRRSEEVDIWTWEIVRLLEILEVLTRKTLTMSHLILLLAPCWKFRLLVGSSYLCNSLVAPHRLQEAPRVRSSQFI